MWGVSGDADENGEVRIWDEDGSASSALPWPMFHHDIARTGLFTEPPDLPELGFPDQLHFFHQVGSGAHVTGTLRIWNKGGGQFEWELDSSASELQITPASGTLTETSTVQVGVDTTDLSEGWTVVGTITATATFEGEEIAGSPAVAPVNVYVGDIVRTFLPLVTRRQ